MSIKERFASLFTKPTNTTAKGYRWEANSEGLDFIISQKEQTQIQNGEAELWVMQQQIVLSMLAEEGLAETIPSGFIVPSATAISLDEITRETLNLPSPWKGHIDATFDGRTGNSTFSLALELEFEPSRYTSIFQLEGPILKFSQKKVYLQTSEQANLFSAWKKHKESEKNESDNLQLVLAAQDAKEAGLNISLALFDRLNVQAPNSVSISIELNENGDLLLTPTFGQRASPEKIQQVLWQLRQKNTNVIRVDGEIILLDEKRLKAVHEILHNRIVPKEKIRDFLKTPTAYIDASMVNLDVGFSARVKGVTVFQQAYFGEADDSGIDWFGASTSTNTEVLFITELPKYIRDSDELLTFQKSYFDAKTTGAKSIIFRKKAFDISEHDTVEQVLKDIENGLQEGRYPDTELTIPTDDLDEGTGDDSQSTKSSSSEADESEPTKQNTTSPNGNTELVVIDIIENDQELEYSLQKSIKEHLYSGILSYDNYLRTPFKHQEEGIRWIIGLALESEVAGGLLADDMGLGKTYMSLAAMDQLYKLQKTQNDKKPNLIVAPLSVLQNWKDEVEKTF
ncbi:MAG: helicase, partial [Deltaproteobacteria bacterium]